MPSTSLDEERSSFEINNEENRLSRLKRRRQELQDLGLLPQRAPPTYTFEIEEPRSTTPPNMMENMATIFGNPIGSMADERAETSSFATDRPASLAERPRQNQVNVLKMLLGALTT
ncbi:hypothetical protein MMC11_001570 [Xylographa trunciseda]|nr:hypothetical protein [Xylographa trunciseda]